MVPILSLMVELAKGASPPPSPGNAPSPEAVYPPRLWIGLASPLLRLGFLPIAPRSTRIDPSSSPASAATPPRRHGTTKTPTSTTARRQERTEKTIRLDPSWSSATGLVQVPFPGLPRRPRCLRRSRSFRDDDISMLPLLTTSSPLSDAFVTLAVGSFFSSAASASASAASVFYLSPLFGWVPGFNCFSGIAASPSSVYASASASAFASAFAFASFLDLYITPLLRLGGSVAAFRSSREILLWTTLLLLRSAPRRSAPPC